MFLRLQIGIHFAKRLVLTPNSQKAHSSRFTRSPALSLIMAVLVPILG
jgi:hypothetical protein